MIPKKSISFLRVLSGLIVLSIFASISIYFLSLKLLSNQIFPNIYIDDTLVGRKTKAQAFKLVSKKTEYLQGALITVLYKDLPVATFSAEELHLGNDSKEVVDQAFFIGRSSDLSTRLKEQYLALTGTYKFHFKTSIRYDDEPVGAFLDQLSQTYNFPAKNALFAFENNKVTTFKVQEDGLEIDSSKFTSLLKDAIQNINKEKSNIVLSVQSKVVKPDITVSKINNFGIEELIGEGNSNYSHSIQSRIFNIKLAASKFHGILVQKGETFSFNKIIGDISSNTGYQPAYIIKNGRTVLGDGGGVCQVSTTMFRAALNTGLPITERNAHAYRVSYYENDSQPGFDATIYTPSVDFRFVNDTQSAILIQMTNDDVNNLLSFKFYGKKDDRKVQISPVTVWDVVPPPEPSYEDDPNLKTGVLKQIDYAAYGSKAKFEYKVIKNGTVDIDQTFYSNFQPWRAVFLRGTGA